MPRDPDLPALVLDLAWAPVPPVLDAVVDHGAVLLRRTSITGAAELERALEALGVRPAPYIEGQSPRERVHGNVYTSTAYPATERVPLHHELSYRASPPELLFFLCVRAPESGGQTPILDGGAFLAHLPRRRAFEGRGILYRKTMHAGFGFGRSWQQHFETDDARSVERLLDADGASWRWLEDGALRVEQVRPAIRPHPRPCWYNQATLWHPSNFGERGRKLRDVLGPERLPTDACWEDGSPIEDALMDEVRAAEHACARRFDWAEGDLLVLDNHRVAHGREPFTGDRLVLVAMGPRP